MMKVVDAARIPDGVWPTMITPFTAGNEIDEAALERVVEWYINRGVHGLFAVCQSSEMFALTLEEKVRLAESVVRLTRGRIPVIASGHTSDGLEAQIVEIRRLSETGIDAFVLVTNRLAESAESDEVWKRNAERLLERIPDVAFGLYECPYPYKRLMTPELLRWCESTGRFRFLKDTCCNVDQLKAKLEAVRGSGLRIFNANSATLLDSLKLGAAGFSGVMANFHPQLYVWLVEKWADEPLWATRLQSFLGLASAIERQNYPVNAKYHMQLEGLPVTTVTRVKDVRTFLPNEQLEVQQLKDVAEYYQSLI